MKLIKKKKDYNKFKEIYNIFPFFKNILWYNKCGENMEKKQLYIGVSLFLSIIFMCFASLYHSVIAFSIFSITTVILYYFFKDKELLEIDLKIIGFLINLGLWTFFLGMCLEIYMISIISILVLTILIIIKSIIEKVRNDRKKNFL